MVPWRTSFSCLARPLGGELHGAALALGAVLVAVLAPRFNPMWLGINLGAIGLGLLMGKGIGRFIFRRVLPTPGK